jgi:hypothetical protein
VKYFADTLVKPYIFKSGYRRICEIGASFGENTDKLLEIGFVEITIIDPCMDLDLSEKYRNEKRVRVFRGLSLETLSKISGAFDCILIDGDHNWYSVYNELMIIQARGLLRNGGTIFFHDVDWPYGRRDMYYQPESIPREFVHPCEKKGIVPGKSELSVDSEFNAGLYNAVHEGGEKNGVLTAIEDFLRENRGAYKFFCLHHQAGLGILLKTKNPLGKIVFNEYLFKIEGRRFLGRLKRAVSRQIKAAKCFSQRKPGNMRA